MSSFDSSGQHSHFCQVCPDCHNSTSFSVSLSCAHCDQKFPLHPRAPSSYDPSDYPPIFNANDERVVTEDIAMLDFDIEQRIYAIGNLQAQLDCLKKTRDLQKFRLAPVRKLPIEILNFIFMEAIALEDADLVSGDLTGMRLAQVCTQWREVTTKSSAHLWTSICICDLRDSSQDSLELRNHRGLYRVLEMHLSRSGDLPLDIELRSYFPRDNLFLIAEFQRLLFPLFETHERWKTLKCCPALLADLFGPPYPALTSFQLVDAGHTFSRRLGLPLSLEFLTRAPNLTSVDLDCQFYDFGMGFDLSAYFERLEMFSGSMHFSSIAGCWSTLRSLKLIQPEADQILSLPFLTALNVSCGFDPQCSTVFRKLSCPKLEELTVEQLQLHGEPLDLLCSFLSECHGTLRALTLQQCTASAEALDKLGSAAPCLRTLTFCTPNPPDVSWVTAVRRLSCLLKLSEVKWEVDSGAGSASVHFLSEVVRSTRQDTSTLDSAKIYLPECKAWKVFTPDLLTEDEWQRRLLKLLTTGHKFSVALYSQV